MAHLYGAIAASSSLTVFFDVSYQSYLPSLVGGENLLDGNAKMALAASVADVAGPGLTGVLVRLITAPMAILVDAISFLCSAISIWSIRKPEPQPQRSAQPHMGREILEGLRWSWRSPALRALAARTAMGSFFLGFGASLYMLFAVRELGLGAALLGAIISIGGVSNLFGAVVVQRLVKRFGLGPTVIGSAVVCGLTCLLPPLARGPVAIAAVMLGAGQLFDFAWPVYFISSMSLRQSITPNQLLGRVNSAMHMLFHGVMPFGALAGGAIAQVLGVRTTMLAGAVGFLLSNLWLVFSPIRRMRELPAAPVSEPV
jgi:predicted MFS family arabinose efflux permease